MEHLSILRLPLYSKPIQCIRDGPGSQAYGSHWQHPRHCLYLLLDMKQALHLAFDGKCARVVVDEVIVGGVHVVLPEEIVELEVEKVLVDGAL